MKKPPECRGCPLYSVGEGFVPPAGKGFSGVAVVGMAPAQAEVRSSTPFHFEGKAGLIFRKILAKGGIDEESLTILNVIQCRPPFDNCETAQVRDAISFCRVHRDKALKGRKCIVALGNLPFEVFCRDTGVESKRGYEYWCEEYECAVIPSLHPSYISYKKATNLIPAVLYDIKVAPQRVPRGPTKMVAIEDPTPAEFAKLCERAMNSPWVVVDIETAMSTGKDEEELDDDPSYQIVRVSMAFNTEEAVSVPWSPLYVDELAKVLACSNDKIFWHENYDVPRLELNGMIINGRIIDAMWVWHFLQPDLPRGLAHAATYYTDLPEWKSQAQAKPAWYSCCDAYATANVYIGVRKDLRQRGIWDIAESHVIDLMQVLRRMRKRGILLDKEALERFKAYLEGKLAELQKILNGSPIRRMHPPKGYKKEPKDTTGMVQIQLRDDVKRNCPECENKKKRKEGCERCKGVGKIVINELVTRWAIEKDFNAMSPPQVKDYMRAMGHPVPFLKKEGMETTGKDFLQAYAAKYPTALYLPILEYRKIDKLRGTYSNWPVGEDGRIHTRFTLAPATGRLSSQNPNVQNIPAEGELADTFRDCLIASPGHVILRRDYTGAEALLTGYFANDPLFMKLSTMGVYTYVLAEHEGIKIDLNAPDLAEVLAEIKRKNKKPRKGDYVSPYKKFKTLVLGICYGLGPDQMFEQNPGVFASKGEARKLRRFFFKLFPKVEQYQESAVAEARTTALIKNPFGYIRWLWDVPGLDGPKAIAQRPQSTLAAIIKRAMLKVDASPIGDYLIWQIHDELVLDVPREKLEWADRILREIMEEPIPELGGLVLRTERKEGRSLKG